MHSNRFLATAVAILVMTAPVAAQDQAVMVDLATVASADDLERLKSSDGVTWWIEAGDSLLLVGDRPRIRSSVDTSLALRDIGRLRPDELALHARGCGDNTTPVPEELILYRGGSYDLVRQPRSFSPGPRMSLPSPHRDDLGGSEWLPVAANSTIARLHRFDAVGPARPVPEIQRIVDRVDATRWFANVSTLAAWDRSSFAPVDLTLARQWLADQFASLGLDVDEPFFSFTYGVTSVTVANVIGHIDGVVHPEEWIVVGAHYDSRNTDIYSTVDTPGADDNASGCAGVIEAAHALVPAMPQRSILFMCYSGEEQGLHGSYAHVDALVANGDLHKVQAMLNMDMIGWSPDATLGVIIETRSGSANTELAELLAHSALTYAPALDPNHVVTTASTCCSDHVPYLDAGRPATMSIHRLRAATPYYHRSTDTPANLGPHAQDIGNAIVRANVAALAQLAGVDRIFQAGNEP